MAGKIKKVNGFHSIPESVSIPGRQDTLGQRLWKTLRHDWAAWLLFLPAILLMYFVVWRPIAMGALYSFMEMKGYTPVRFVGFENYLTILRDTEFVKTLINTVWYVVLSLVVGFLPPVLIAIVLNEVVHGQRFFKFAVYFPSVVPAIVVSMIWTLVYAPDASGLFNMILEKLGFEPYVWLQDTRFTILFIIISTTWHGFGATTMYYLASLQSVKQELYEAAVIDGAGLFRRLRTIALPHISGIMLLFLVRQIISVFQIMVEPLAMTAGGPNNASLSLALQAYRYAFVYFKPAESIALSMVTFAILMVLTLFYFRLEKRIDAA